MLQVFGLLKLANPDKNFTTFKIFLKKDLFKIILLELFFRDVMVNSMYCTS